MNGVPKPGYSYDNFVKMVIRQHFWFVFVKTIAQRSSSSWPCRINEKP